MAWEGGAGPERQLSGRGGHSRCRSAEALQIGPFVKPGDPHEVSREEGSMPRDRLALAHMSVLACLFCSSVRNPNVVGLAGAAVR